MSHEKEHWPLKAMVEVDWIDSCTRSRWDTKESYAQTNTPVRCRSAGYLSRKTKDAIVILQSQTSEGEVSASMTIPRACVIRIRILK